MFKTFLSQHAISEYTFNTDFLPTVENREFWESFQNETCVEQAERELDYVWPIIKATDFMEYKKSGNRLIMENTHFDRRNHLVLFALAELKENKGRFLPQIVNGLFAICEETFWGLSAHLQNVEKDNLPIPEEPRIDLFAAETAEHVTTVVHLLKKPLTDFSPTIIDRVENELEARIKRPYLTHRDDGWMGYTGKWLRVNNWNPWILSNLTTVFLLSESKRPRLDKAIKRILEDVQHYYDSLPADGGCDEGTSYWQRAGASLYELMYQLKTATDGRLDLFDDQKIRLIASYMQKAHIASDIFVNTGDSHATGKSGFMPLLYGYARETGQEQLKSFSVYVYREGKDHSALVSNTQRTLRRIIFNSQLMREMDGYTVSDKIHEPLELLPDMQLAVLRRGDMALAVKGGFNNESHNHNDVGSISLYDGSTPVLVDVGINTYTRFTFDNRYRYTVVPWTQTSYHNLPLIGDVGQCIGENRRADCFEASEEQVKVSFAGTYPDGAGILSLCRIAAWSENGVTVTDSFKLSKKASITETLMSVLPVRRQANTAIIGERYRVSADTGELNIEYIPFDDALLERDWGTKGVSRITFCAEGAERITLSVEKI